MISVIFSQAFPALLELLFSDSKGADLNLSDILCINVCLEINMLTFFAVFNVYGKRDIG